MATNLGQLLEEAAAVRKRGNWAAAQQLYESAAVHAPNEAAVQHNLALCLHARGLHTQALEHAQAATQRAPRLAAAWVLLARIERALDRAEAAQISLEHILDMNPGEALASLELAGLLLNELGDAQTAQRLAAPLVDDPLHAEDARLAMLMAKLYDRQESAEELTRQIVQYSDRYLKLPGFAFAPARAPRPKGKPLRKRVGLLSPLFCASPVYFFTYGALSLLQHEVDFVVLNRGTRTDWARARFRAMAREWHDLAHLGAPALADEIHALELDALFDLGGWIDPSALKALSVKPAKKLYKWVGGQSCTTGLRIFDGFLTDIHQTPAGTAHLYTEPLVVFDHGYVSYTPGPDAPAPRPLPDGRCVYGIVSNPVKIPQSFLREMPRLIARLPEHGVLRFVDRRYRHAALRKRVLAALGPAGAARAEFISPASQREYLIALAGIDTVLDTAPYNGGLTTVEALSSGARCMTRPGTLFCERHSISHLRFSGMPVLEQDGWFCATPGRAPAQSTSRAHEALAASLSALLRT